MGTLLALLMLFRLGAASAFKFARGSSAVPAVKAAASAQEHAHKTAKRAAATNHPADHAAAAKAASTAAVLTHKAATQSAAASKVPPPWPAAVPKGLAPWPAGWIADNPPPPAVVARAWQLLPTLWKKGAGTRAVEQTAGRWITYVAADHGKGVKGVTAFRQKVEPPHQPRDQHGASATW